MPRLSEAQLAGLDQELERSPLVHGWEDQWWALARIKTLIGRLEKVPGQTVDAPLNRLFHDTGRRRKNRDTAQTACRRYDPNFGHAGLDCDEYPFAATYQGCAQHMYDSKAPVDHYSAKMLDSTENQLAGSQLAQFYNNERIIDYQNEDGFTVQIIG